MFEFVRKHTRLLQFVLVLLIFPSFVFFGVQGYSRFSEGASGTVATVAGHPITQAELDAALREQGERMRQQMPGIDPKLLQGPAFKREALDGIVRNRVLAAAAVKLNLVTTDARLQRVFQSDPQFGFLRRPDGSLNTELLAAQGMSSDVFAQRLRQDLSDRQVLLGIAASEVTPAGVAAPALDALLQQRDVQVLRFNTADYTAKSTPTEADLTAYYKAHLAEFQAPERADIDYVVLDVDALKNTVQVSEDEARKSYQDNISRYTTPEERRASHILIKADKTAPAADRAKAKARAEALLAELKKTPGAFADLARKNSDDPGSAVKGGDLDFFGRGAMVKPFEDAAFSLKKGEMSDVVESDFGYHIIELTDVRGGNGKPFEAVRADIEDQLRRQAAQKKFTSMAVDFGNMVYEQADSLKPVADKFQLPLLKASGVTRTPAPGARGVLASPKFLDAVFGADALRGKHNTDAVETAPNQLVAGHVNAFVPAHQLTMAEVHDRLQTQVAAQMGADAARRDGAARLAAAKAAPQAPLADATLTVSRSDAQNLPAPLLDAVLRAPANALPAVVGVDLGAQGYAVAKVIKVVKRDPAAPEMAQGRGQFGQAWADAEAQAYYTALKSQFKVDIHAKTLAADTSGNATEGP